ncbi:rod shape-determining protein MreD [Streptomyces sp. HNM0574]|uniref:rod shape-determining protein MreD n=1 Tax=Streptomyces sp. HNM0574 TaxID=2714954 RepID=UPI00146F3B6D|nr:rod shape-determining protein MreD [Streptomyces sp. HNM0574]NLU66373.1 rod shape-determining protein MreD [Streptomyces sp. HNM0574]
MRLNRMLLSTFLVVVALIVQVSVLARLQLPGAVPDLLLLVVLGLAMVYGHTAGALIGFVAGLLADIAPPADHAVGRYALVLCVVGYVAGLTKPESGQHRSATVPMLVVGVAAISSTLLYAGVGALVGDTAAGTAGILGLLFTATLYDLLLAPFTVPVIMALARRTQRDPVATEGAGGGTASGRDRSYGWLTSGAGIGIGGSGAGIFSRPGGRGGFGKAERNGKTVRFGGQKSELLGSGRRTARNKAGKIKGVKKL